MKKSYDVLIVGAGFAGSVPAERLAADLGQKVLVCDRRPHIGGNAYDHADAAGLLVHQYGPHIFHTNSADLRLPLALHGLAGLRASCSCERRGAVAPDFD